MTTPDPHVSSTNSTSTNYLNPGPGSIAQPPVVINNPPPQGQFFTAADIEKARQEEKDKLYGRLNKMEEQTISFKTELDTLKAERDKAATDLAAQQKAKEDAEKAANEAKMSAQELVESKKAELESQMATFKTQMESQQAVIEKERQFLGLQSFTQRRVAEEVADNNVAPEFLDYIGGDSEAEVEASITKAKEKTASIVAATFGQGTPSQATPAPATPGVSPTGFGPTGPLDTLTGLQRQYSPQDIASMSMAEYAQFRSQSGLDRAGKEKGMFS